MHTAATLTALALAGCLALGSTASAQIRHKAGARYWPLDQREVCVEIDGYGFDFEPARRGRGIVDGPLSHNGGYRILKNARGQLELMVHFGTDTRQRNEMDVVLRLRRGRATVTGAVMGRAIGTISAPVRCRDGRFTLTFRVRNRQGVYAAHTIKWRG